MISQPRPKKKRYPKPLTAPEVVKLGDREPWPLEPKKPITKADFINKVAGTGHGRAMHRSNFIDKSSTGRGLAKAAHRTFEGKYPPALVAPDFMALPDPQQGANIVGPLLAHGDRVMVVGYKGEGKSTLALQAFKTAIAGGTFLTKDWQAEGGAKVLIVDLEQSQRSLKKKLADAGLEREKNVTVVRLRGVQFDVEDAEDRAWLEGIFAQGHFDIVLLDPFYKLHRGDPNDSQAMTALMSILDKWTDEYGFCLVLLHHKRKPQTGQRKADTHAVKGAGEIINSASIIVDIAKKQHGEARLTFVADRDDYLQLEDDTEWTLAWEKGVGFSRADAGLSPLARCIVTARAKAPRATQKEIAETVGCHLQSVKNWWAETTPEGAGDPEPGSIMATLGI